MIGMIYKALFVSGMALLISIIRLSQN